MAWNANSRSELRSLDGQELRTKLKTPTFLAGIPRLKFPNCNINPTGANKEQFESNCQSIKQVAPNDPFGLETSFQDAPK